MPATTSVKPDSSRRTSNPIFPSRSSSSTSLTIAQTPLAQDGASTDSDPQVASGSKARPRATGKTSGACVHCKSLKVRCQFTTGHAKCDRCEAGNHECVPRSRKKRKVAPTQDDLQMRSYQQDEQIRTLLRQFDQLRMDAKISDWIRRAETTVRSGWSSARSARPLTSHYYSALIGPLNIDLSPSNPDFKRLPMLLRTGILEPYEVLDLFNLHFERVNSFFALLDGELHSPQKLVWTSHFLFTAICACASRHYLRRPGLHDVLMDIGRDAAAEALVSGKKSVETVQAFLLLAVYPLPEKKWTNNRSWLLTGAAIRLAQELELDKTLHELSQRENLNRTRTWIMCFCVDKSHAAECGKMHMIRPNGRLMQGELRSWYKTNPSINTPYDIALCGYTEMFLLLANFRHEIGFCDVLKQKCAEGYDVLTEAITYDKRLAELSAWWSLVLVEDPNYLICPIVHYRTHSFSMVSSYLRLVVLSVGFQHAVKQGITRESYILQQSITVAQAAIKTVIEWLFPSGFLGWAMEAEFAYTSFCAAFLLNLLRPKFLPLLTYSQCANIIGLVQRLIRILSSDEVVVDERHSPILYSKFLATLLDQYYTPSLQAEIRTAPEVETATPRRTEYERESAHAYRWPDTPTNLAAGDLPRNVDSHSPRMAVSHDDYVVLQRPYEPEMDFSLPHFVQSTRRAEDYFEPPASVSSCTITLENLQYLAAGSPGYNDPNWLGTPYGNLR